MFNEMSYLNKLAEKYGDRMKGSQLIHEQYNNVRIYVVYLTDGSIEIARLFTNYFTEDVDVSVEQRIQDIDHTLMPLGDTMGLIEVIVNTVKGNEV
ncbi:hypothetical protein [Pseudobacillus badius]|uniref:hypothetical protein n=1 Tax=Bacillus badius TaxID=1455 RepID=UPI0007B378A5|nr:hypothetical protein [Bacillus badius]KZR57515.1 hypothetical protein A3781_19675 [Bacillus badius]